MRFAGIVPSPRTLRVSTSTVVLPARPERGACRPSARRVPCKCTARRVQVHRPHDATHGRPRSPAVSHAPIATPFALRPSARRVRVQLHGASRPIARASRPSARRGASKCTARRVQLHGASRAIARPVAPPRPAPEPRPPHRPHRHALSLFRPIARDAPCNCTAPIAYTRGHERQHRLQGCPRPAARVPRRRRTGAARVRVAALQEFNWALDWFDRVPAARRALALRDRRRRTAARRG